MHIGSGGIVCIASKRLINGLVKVSRGFIVPQKYTRLPSRPICNSRGLKAPTTMDTIKVRT